MHQGNPELGAGDQTNPLRVWFERLAISMLPGNDPVFRDDPGRLSKLQTWISAGNVSPDEEKELAPHFKGEPNIIEFATAQIARQVIGQGAAIVSGHDWREGGVMQVLAEFASGDRLVNQRVQPSIINVLRKSKQGDPTEERMRDEGVICMVDVHETLIGDARAKMAEHSDVCVCLGGKLAKYEGSLPGIIEEASLAAERGMFPIICPCLGGGSRWLTGCVVSFHHAMSS